MLSSVIESFEYQTMTVDIIKFESDETEFWYQIYKTDVRRSRCTNTPSVYWNGTEFASAEDARNDAILECDKIITHNYVYPPEV